jgi:hypothetical protein
MANIIIKYQGKMAVNKRNRYTTQQNRNHRQGVQQDKEYIKYLIIFKALITLKHSV